MREQLAMKFEFYREQVLDWTQSLNDRERLLLMVASALLILFLIFSGIESALTKMQVQRSQLEKTEQDFDLLGPLLQRYNRLALQKSEIESQFQNKAGRVPARSYIEDIAKNRAKITSQLNINQTGSDDFGDHFRRSNFKVTFQTGDLDQLVSFLQAVEEGSQPLLLTRIDVNRIGSQLRFSAEISSIEPK